ncbi:MULTISPECIES: DUF1905 domain-containing protein [unclassified Micromonospora]|uniref:DUF1905 domain-containing protein n=1 Tax=unclassified Micromonospora TaxID=2617518 RepID=UPI001C22EA28|nr:MULTISPECIES: DUF1905 domain-containing protein [unclassified Micromonospora]MBU8855795.1 DUF1905 domain-containing protein [Micromonospora sp. WMMB482]MDM4778051.1 DUF1905 domain-containing protein [Micromonospora sp. b486]
MELAFSGEVWFWRGPAPYHFVTVPDEQSAAIEAASASVTYGWGMIPVTVRIGGTGLADVAVAEGRRYVVPLRVAARRAEGIELGDRVDVRLTVDV